MEPNMTTSNGDKSYGAVVASVIIILLLIVGGLYYWGKVVNDKTIKSGTSNTTQQDTNVASVVGSTTAEQDLNLDENFKSIDDNLKGI